MKLRARVFALIAVVLCVGLSFAQTQPPAHKAPPPKPPAPKPAPQPPPAHTMKPLVPHAPARTTAPSTQPSTQPTTQPATQPSTQPSTQPGALATPHDVMRAVLQVVGMMESPARFNALIACDKDDEKKMVAALTQRYIAADAFYKAINAKFGGLAAAGAMETLDDLTVMGERKFVIYALDGMEHLTEKIDGDEASLMVDGKPAWILRRVDGAWRLAFAELTKGDSSIEGPLPYAAELTTAEAACMRTVTAEIMQGKYKDEQEVLDSFEKKMKPITLELEKKHKIEHKGE